MENAGKILFVSVLAIFLTAGSALAFVTPITIFDRNYSNSDAWYQGADAVHEDQEVERDMQETGQSWDLEGFLLSDDNILTMIGGYDFENGNANMHSGDIFIDVTGDAQFGYDHDLSTSGNIEVNDTLGYDYVLDMDFSDLTYDVYELTDDSWTITSLEYENQGSNPWQYSKGGNLLEGYENVSFGYKTGLTDEQTGFQGGSHNEVSGLDLNFLALDIPRDFTVHFTMECGNDNLMGKGSLTAMPDEPEPSESPEPATMLLLASGLAGLSSLRKRFNKS